MKTILTPEQSQRLIELGVAPSKASSQNIYMKQGYGSRGIFQTPVAQPIFVLSDILQLLPKMIRHKGDPYCLEISWDEDWGASYFNEVNFVTPNEIGMIAFEHASELIDALFELLVWSFKNHPAKSKRNEQTNQI